MKKLLFTSLLLLVSIVMQAQIDKPSNPAMGIIKPPVGTLSITSTPAGCSVAINGQFIGTTGTTPISLKKNAGSYSISFSLDGYKEQTKTVKVNAGKTSKCNVIMEKLELLPKDSIILMANDIIGMSTTYDISSLNQEEKDIVSFQNNAVNYAKGVKEMYDKIMEKDDASKLSVDELKVIITNCVLRNQHCNNLEKPCIQSAMTMFQNMGSANSNVYQGVDMVELAKLAGIVQKQAISNETTAEIVRLIGELKLVDALDLYQQGLLNPEIIERYKSFLFVIKGFYTLSNMRLTEIKNSKDS